MEARMEVYMDDKSRMLFKKGTRRASSAASRASKGLDRSVVPGRLASLVREQRARFYIMRRCVTMLVCWKD